MIGSRRNFFREHMSDLFHRTIRLIGRHPFWMNSQPLIIGLEHTKRKGAFIVASTHESPFDVPLLIRHSKRMLDFVSIVEVFAKPFVGWFYGSMNAFPLDRNRRDPKTVRVILDRLARGRVVAMFPEGRLSPGDKSVLVTGKIRPGIGKIAQLANVPIVPVIVVNSRVYRKLSSWLPIRRTRYAVAFGPAILPDQAPEQLEEKLIESWRELHRSLYADYAGHPALTVAAKTVNTQTEP